MDGKAPAAGASWQNGFVGDELAKGNGRAHKHHAAQGSWRSALAICRV
jgi:hypothetical protein